MDQPAKVSEWTDIRNAVLGEIQIGEPVETCERLNVSDPIPSKVQCSQLRQVPHRVNV